MCSYQMPLASPTPAALMMTPPFYTHATAAAGSPSSTSISRSSSPQSAVYLDAAHETILKSFAPPMSVSAAAYYQQQQQQRHTAWTPVSSHSHSRASSIDSSCSSSPDMLSPSTTARSCYNSVSHTMPPHMVQLAHAYAVHQLPNGHYLYVPTLISFHMTAPAALGVAPVVVASPAPVAVAAPAPIAAPIPQRAASATPSDESDFEFKYDDEPSAHDATTEAVQAAASSTFAAALQANMPHPLLEKELAQSATATAAAAAAGTPVSAMESGVTVYSATMHRRAASLLRLASAPITRLPSPSPVSSMSSSSSSSSPSSSSSSSMQLSPSPTMPIRFRKVPVLDDDTMSMVMERVRSNTASPCPSTLHL